MKRRVTLGMELAFFRRQLQQILEQVAPAPISARGFSPLVDLVAIGGEFVVRVDLPGVDPASVRVDLVGNELRISGEKPVPSPGNRKYHQVERRYGYFLLEVVLPNKVTLDGAKAVLRAGVLEVKLRKEADHPPQPVPIPVETEEP